MFSQKVLKSLDRLVVLLNKHSYTIATAESCTGGLISTLLTHKSGSSSYFSGAIIAYSNSIKESLLNVDKNTLIEYGAVSLPVVEQMAISVQKTFATHLAIAVSGIAGPDGGTVEKPAGTVCIGIITPKKALQKSFVFLGNREEVRLQTALTSFELLCKELS